MAELRRQELRKPTQIPTEKLIYGPMPKPRPCDGILAAAQDARDKAFLAAKEAKEGDGFFKHGQSYNGAIRAIDAAFRAISDHAELELVDATGAEIRSLGTRGRSPKLVKAPLTAKPKALQQYNPYLTGLLEEAQWLRDLAIDTDKVVSKGISHWHKSEGVLITRCYDELQARDTIMQGVKRPAYLVGDDDVALQQLLDETIIDLATAREQLAWTLFSAINESYTMDEQSWSPTVKTDAEHALRLARVLEKKLSGAKQLESHKLWKSSITETGAVATKRAFMYTQLPEVVQQQTVLDSLTGVYTAEPLKVLNGAASKLAETWKSSPQKPTNTTTRPWGGGSALPRLTVKRLSDAALSFAHGTSYTYDGFHPRHYALLQYKTLLAITMLYEAIECMGVMPTESQHAMIALLPKPKGGFRPIALLPGVCRLHGKARKPDIDQWEAENAREYLACSKGRGALDAVWKRSILAEYAVNSHTCALALLWDLKSFFDTIDLDLLRERAQQVNFPAVLVNLAIATYKTPRYVHTRQGVAEPVYPGRGVLPGCSFAKALIRGLLHACNG